MYSDVVGTGAAGASTITDTIITSFSDFSIPTVFDATLTLPAAEITSRQPPPPPKWRRL